ncbi:hypothetical protein CH373_17535 [Leptospira perolatii]|uniref:Transporter n=1 Tax=Leptospira perolatii TaxID=2023191 RepID=A0A2M9ZI92_9LEPT|nr:transporter [Leptospira perolatii]PJZ69078.1 hypothetical protein CH360_12380 [Leptospira perolatii]PJZ71787.1 hypothetical protein CH373_17535 [Leptospira perolatii]
MAPILDMIMGTESHPNQGARLLTKLLAEFRRNLCGKFLVFLLLFSFPLLGQGSSSEQNGTKEKVSNSAIEEDQTSTVDHSKHKNGRDSSHDHSVEVPAGITGAHYHPPGKIMVEYRYMLMNMSGLYNGSSKLDPFLVLNTSQYSGNLSSTSTSTTLHNHAGSANSASGSYRYDMVPTKMNMEMHMAMIMGSFSENLSYMVMVPFVRNSMEMLNSGNYQKSYMSAQGVGDIQVQTSYKILKGETHTLALNFGLTLPTGSINEKDFMMQGQPKSTVSYGMQPGTGTFNPVPGVTYTGRIDRFFWGAQALAMVHYGANQNGYRFGDKYEGSVWSGYKLTDWFALLVRVNMQKWENLIRRDPSLPITMTPQNDPDKQGGRRTIVYIGSNLKLPFLGSDIRANLEFGAPVYQHLNGPQVGLQSVVNFSLQITL